MNYLAIVTAVAASMVIGWVWYSPLMFAKPWMRLIGKSEEDLKKGAPGGYASAVVGAVLQAWTVSWLLDRLYTFPLAMDGFVLTLILGMGLVLPAMLGSYIFAGRPMKLFLIDWANRLVTLVAIGLIIGGWQ